MSMEYCESVAVQTGQPTRAERIAGLLEAARAGEHDAVAQLVTELSPLLWQVARAAGLGLRDAEDVLQTTWMRLLDHLEDIQAPGALTAWLVTTTRREAWRVRAVERKQVPSDTGWLDSVPDPAPGTEELAVTHEQRRQLWAAFGRLSERCQELLRIVAFVPRPDYDVVAAKLGMPRGSIGPTRGRCLAKLRELLSSAEGSPS
jgi:RNA polymerase sigma factor (sigma-70 family)